MRAAAVSGQLITVLGWRQQERTAVKFKRNAYFDRACADICKERLGADLQRIWGNRIAERIIKRELEAVLFVFKDGYVGWRNLDLIEPIGQLRAGNRAVGVGSGFSVTITLTVVTRLLLFVFE